jgi:hypothetical protein
VFLGSSVFRTEVTISRIMLLIVRENV